MNYKIKFVIGLVMVTIGMYALKTPLMYFGGLVMLGGVYLWLD